MELTTYRVTCIVLIMTRTEIAARYIAAEYGVSVDNPLVAEIVADMPAEAIDTIIATVEIQPWLIGE